MLLKNIDPSTDPLFLREKVLMRLAECCYRTEKVDDGLKYLETLQESILPKRIYTTYLL